jgi:hypothetical protein
MSVTPKSPTVVLRPPPQHDTVPSGGIAGTIQQAAQRTGASFEYLLATAKVESNLDPNSKAKSSSATGLFQFIEQTWLGLIKSTGKALGLGQYANAISRNAAGRYQVTDARLRHEILQLRKDPAANATMAAVFTQENAATLGQRIRREPTDSELYIAHFFGSGGAGRLIGAVESNPQANAAAMFPAAARANRSIFYDRQGQARSVAGVYAELDRRYQVARANVIPGQAPTAVAARHPAVPVAPAASSARAPDTAGAALAFAAAQTPVAEPPKPDFRTLFHTEAARGAVAPVVAELWGSRMPVRPLQAPAPAAAGTPLDLFQERPPDAQGLFRGERA